MGHLCSLSLLVRRVVSKTMLLTSVCTSRTTESLDAENSLVGVVPNGWMYRGSGTESWDDDRWRLTRYLQSCKRELAEAE